jgi:hypothetical protein
VLCSITMYSPDEPQCLVIKKVTKKLFIKLVTTVFSLDRLFIKVPNASATPTGTGSTITGGRLTLPLNLRSIHVHDVVIERRLNLVYEYSTSFTAVVRGLVIPFSHRTL